MIRACFPVVIMLLVAGCDRSAPSKMEPVPGPTVQESEEPTGAVREPEPRAEPEPAPGAPGGDLPKALQVPDPVAIVDGTPIPAKALYAELHALTKKAGSLGGPQVPELMMRLLMNLIDRRLIAQAGEKAGLKVPKGVVDEGVAKLKARFSSPEAFARHLERSGSTEARLRGGIAEAWIVSELLRAQGHDDEDPIPEEALRAFFDKNPKIYKHKGGPRLRQILVRLARDAAPEAVQAARAKIRRAAAEVRGGKPFAEVARALSEGPRAAQGGDLGIWRKGALPPEADAIVPTLKPKVLPAPIRTDQGLHLLWVEAIEAPGTLGYAAVKERIRKLLERRRRGEARKKLIDGLRRAARVELRWRPPELQKKPRE